MTQPEVDQAAFEIIANAIEDYNAEKVAEAFVAEAIINALARAGYTIKRKDDPA